MKILQKNLNALFSQTNDYTCAPIALLNSAIAMKRNIGLDESTVIKILNCSPLEGTTLDSIAHFTKKYLSCVNFGENTWDFQSSCIVVITEKRLLAGKKTHAVLVFGMYENMILWHCPYFQELHFSTKEDFLGLWHSEDNAYKRYSYNFQSSLIDFIVED